jgi:hypothetical protein
VVVEGDRTQMEEVRHELTLTKVDSAETQTLIKAESTLLDVGLPEPEPETAGTRTLAPFRDYGLPGDHRYTAPETRVPSEVILRTEEEYATKFGGTVHKAAPDAFRTHDDDEDPIVATFEDVLTDEEIAHILSGPSWGV